jgi:hypothetical protein
MIKWSFFSSLVFHFDFAVIAAAALSLSLSLSRFDLIKRRLIKIECARHTAEVEVSGVFIK